MSVPPKILTFPRGPVGPQGPPGPPGAAGAANLPDQTGQAGKVLGTNGSSLSWVVGGGGGGGMAIGGAVTSGTPKSALFVDASGNLAQDNANFKYDSATQTLTAFSKVVTGSIDAPVSGPVYLGGTNANLFYAVTSIWPSVDNSVSLGDTATPKRFSNVVGKLHTAYFASGDAVKNTVTDGLILQNANAAANNVTGDDGQVYSPRVRLTGAGRNTSGSSVVVDWDVFNRPVQGSAASPTTQLGFRYQVNAGGYTELMTLDSNGSGRVGINTTAPLTTLDVKSTVTGTEPRINVNSTATDASQVGLQFSNAATFKGGFFRLKSTDAIQIWNPTAAILTGDTSGNWTPQSDNGQDWGAIGTRWRNVYALGVHSGSSANTMTSTVASGGSRAGFVLKDSNNNLGTDKWLSFQNTANGERMFIADGTINSSAGSFTLIGVTRVILQGQGSQVWWDGSTLFPANDNVRNCGAPANRWAGVYSTIYGGTSQNVAAASSVTISPTNGEFVRITLSATTITSVTISAGVSAQVLTVEVVNDAVGSRAIPTTWTNVRFAGGSYTNTLGANAKDTITFRYNSTDSKWDEIGRAMNLS